jgi:hypothetical protein
MSLNNAKHIIAEFDGVRCTVVESGLTKERLAFLKELLEYNKFEVKVKEEPSELPGEPVKISLGVTDLTFNPVFAIFERSLKTKDGQFISPAIWNQQTTVYKREYWRE